MIKKTPETKIKEVAKQKKEHNIQIEIDALCVALMATEPGSLIHAQITERLSILNVAMLQTINELTARVLSHITKEPIENILKRTGVANEKLTKEIVERVTKK